MNIQYVFRHFIIYCLFLYRKIVSPLFPSCCRYNPTCSEYASQAVLQHGVCKGIVMSVLRISRCSPMFCGGDDNVPTVFGMRSLIAEYKKRLKNIS